jgi:MarR family transcriptional regulator, organic hydroperoxide resistance regulator
MSNDKSTPEAGTQLERVLWWHGQFRRRLEPLRVTPLQAGMLLFLRHHEEAKLKDAADALCVRPPTLTDVLKDLVRKRWVTKRYSVRDRRELRLRLSPQGTVLVQRVHALIQDVGSDLTGAEEDSAARHV